VYKYGRIASLAAGIAWLVFAFSAFQGFHFWYLGFVFFFWLSLSLLNYRHRTTLWFLRNRTLYFALVYAILIVIGFVGDYVIGQQVANLWRYPYYTAYFDWVRLYALIYPLGGLAVLELVLFLGALFREKLILLPKPHAPLTRPLNLADHMLDGLVVCALIAIPVLYWAQVSLPFAHLSVYVFLAWVAVATAQFVYHVRHGSHWVAILLAALLMSVFLHEVPNTAVFEWEYFNAPLLNLRVLSIPLWVMAGWYVIVVLMLRIWVRLMLPVRARAHP
jgi:hypothetical protein